MKSLAERKHRKRTALSGTGIREEHRYTTVMIEDGG